MMPGITLHGRTQFAWRENGAFLSMHSSFTEAGIPTGVALIGSDDDAESLTMLYFDERGVSRQFDVRIDGDTIRWSRTSPGFSQRFALTIGRNGNTLHGVSELSRDDTTWEHDLELHYTRSE